MKPQFIVIGLGNVGKSYENTRHNVGFIATERAAASAEWKDKQKFLAFTAEGEIDGVPCLFVKPATYMNRSGESVRKLLSFYKLKPENQLLVCCDDIDIPLGTHRLRMNGGPGTHNGLKSIVEAVGESFPRLRIGIGPKPSNTDLAVWVLSALSESERKALEPAYQSVIGCIRQILKYAPSARTDQ